MILSNDDFYPNRFKDFHGFQMTLGYNILAPPFIDYTVYENGTKELSGLEIEIMKYMAQSLNWTLAFRQTTDGAWGTLVNPKKNLWNGVIGLVQNRVL